MLYVVIPSYDSNTREWAIHHVNLFFFFNCILTRLARRVLDTTLRVSMVCITIGVVRLVSQSRLERLERDRNMQTACVAASGLSFRKRFIFE